MRVVAKRRGTKHVVFESVDHFRIVEGVSVRGATKKDVLEDPESGNRYIAKLGGRNNDLEVTGASPATMVASDSSVATSYTKAPEELVHGMQLFRELYDENAVMRVNHAHPDLPPSTAARTTPGHLWGRELN
jgi:hypothetical protein